MIKIFLFLCFIFFCGCCPKCEEEEDFRTVPVTNNPTIVPSYGSELPNMM